MIFIKFKDPYRKQLNFSFGEKQADPVLIKSDTPVWHSW